MLKRAKGWLCDQCRTENMSFSQHCIQCRASRPAEPTTRELLQQSKIQEKRVEMLEAMYKARPEGPSVDDIRRSPVRRTTPVSPWTALGEERDVLSPRGIQVKVRKTPSPGLLKRKDPDALPHAHTLMVANTVDDINQSRMHSLGTPATTPPVPHGPAPKLPDTRATSPTRDTDLRSLLSTESETRREAERRARVLEERLLASRQRVTELTEDLSNANKSGSRIKELEAIIATQKFQLDEKAKEIATLQKQLEFASKDCEKQMKETEKLEAKIRQLGLESVANRGQERDAEKDAQLMKFKELVASLEAQLRDKETRIRQLEDKDEGVPYSEYSTLQKLYHEIEEQSSEKSHAIEVMTEKLKKQKEQFVDLQSTLAERDQDVMLKEATNNELRNYISSLEHELRIITDDNAALRRIKEEQCADTNEALSKLRRAEDMQREQQLEMEMFGERNSKHVTTLQEEVREKGDLIKSLEKQLSDQRSAVESVCSQLTDANDLTNTQDARLRDKENEVNALTTQLRALEDSLAESRKQADDLEDSLAESQKQAQEAVNQVQEVMRSVETKEAEITQLQQQRQEKEQDVSTKDQQLEDSAEEIAALKSQIASLTTRLEEAIERKIEAEVKSDQKVDELARHQATITALENQIEIYQSAARSVIEDLEDALRKEIEAEAAVVPYLSPPEQLTRDDLQGLWRTRDGTHVRIEGKTVRFDDTNEVFELNDSEWISFLDSRPVPTAEMGSVIFWSDSDVWVRPHIEAATARRTQLASVQTDLSSPLLTHQMHEPSFRSAIQEEEQEAWSKLLIVSKAGHTAILQTELHEAMRSSSTVPILEQSLKNSQETVKGLAESLKVEEEKRRNLQDTVDALTNDAPVDKQREARLAAAVQEKERELEQAKEDISSLEEQLHNTRKEIHNAMSEITNRDGDIERLIAENERLKHADPSEVRRSSGASSSSSSSDEAEAAAQGPETSGEDRTSALQTELDASNKKVVTLEDQVAALKEQLVQTSPEEPELRKECDA
eukprot:TRINITY_DN313_c0_g1_i14.p1 TRINITY_DN313_c0_g1~~TRINITY_DN313_c0_g1_i14.p1  ORF type:complete len:1016 (+),score=362.69 TRINITY_DN313_c0_g1_i14:78-3125(+)